MPTKSISDTVTHGSAGGQCGSMGSLANAVPEAFSSSVRFVGVTSVSLCASQGNYVKQKYSYLFGSGPGA